MPALALTWAHVRTGSTGAQMVALVNNRSRTGWHRVQTLARRSTGAKARRFLQHPSPSGSDGEEGAAFRRCLKTRVAARGPHQSYFQPGWLRIEGRKTPGTRHGADSHMRLRTKSQAVAR